MPIGRTCSTTLARNETFRPEWHHVDATDQVLGRLAARIATVLMGKHKPTYTPHVDTGDFVVVTNCERIGLPADKAAAMHYDRYSFYPGGWKTETAKQLLQRHPDRILRFAVRRMMPKNAIGRRMLNKLKIYRGPEHPHQAQQPKPWAY